MKTHVKDFILWFGEEEKTQSENHHVLFILFLFLQQLLSFLLHTRGLLSPAVLTVSEPGQTSVWVSWGPLQPGTVELL